MIRTFGIGSWVKKCLLERLGQDLRPKTSTNHWRNVKAMCRGNWPFSDVSLQLTMSCQKGVLVLIISSMFPAFFVFAHAIFINVFFFGQLFYSCLSLFQVFNYKHNTTHNRHNTQQQTAPAIHNNRQHTVHTTHNTQHTAHNTQHTTHNILCCVLMGPEGRVDLVRLRGFCGYGMNTVFLRRSPMVDVCCGMPQQ